MPIADQSRSPNDKEEQYIVKKSEIEIKGEGNNQEKIDKEEEIDKEEDI